MTIVRRILVFASMAVLLSAQLAQAQTTGSITGTVRDASGAVLPGVSITLSGDRLIGGPQTQVSDESGTYRFDRLVPGSYNVKFELQGFRTVDRPDVRISAAFVATINGKMEVGSVSETITVTGESPTVDVRSNLQQTVMNQEILEGIPTGRDPWSLAKLIPGVQVATYDVGGTQSMQQSSLSAHGSNTNDVSYNIDGATVNWPGGGGGATMIYYDQGMFEEVNYMTSAIPAEMMAGGVSINMVTKDGGNQWRGRLPYNFSNQDLQSENWAATQARNPNFRGNPEMGRRWRRDDDLLRPGHVRRGQLHDLGDPRRNDGRRRVDQHGHQGRRQPVARPAPVQLLEPGSAVRELAGDAGAQPQLPRQPDAQDLRPEPVGRRQADREPRVDQRHDPAVDRQQIRQQPESRRHAGARRQHLEELLRQNRRAG